MELSGPKKFVFFFIIQEMELFSPKIKKVLIFSQKKAFLIFREIKLFNKTSYISRGNFWALKKKKNTEKISYISWNGTSSPRIINFLIFQEGTCKTWKTRISYISFHIFCLLRENFPNINVKEKSFLYLFYNKIF